MKHRAYKELVSAMIAQPRDFTLEDIYKLVCRPPHQNGLDTAQLHSRVSRAVGEARVALKKLGYVLGPGELRHSYKAVKRSRR